MIMFLWNARWVSGPYTIVWVTFTMSMTQDYGMGFLKNRFEFESQKNTFNIGVNRLAGIVLGYFAAWTVMKVLLGFPIPFLPIVGTVCGDLAICYLMVILYDWSEGNLKEETVEDAASCC
jgi:hypothetical protein